MPRVLIWDLPTRMFHWLLTIGFFISAAISVTADDDNPLFSVHMIVGIVLGVMVLLRIVWGFVGTRHARFTSFLFSPFIADEVRFRRSEWHGTSIRRAQCRFKLRHFCNAGVGVGNCGHWNNDFQWQ
jgi:cytochrome b